MTSRQDPPLAPIPGESRLFLWTAIVLCVLSGGGLVAAFIASFFRDDMGPTMIAAAIVLGFSLFLLVLAYVQRRKYLRDVLYGRVVVRERWSPDSTHSW